MYINRKLHYSLTKDPGDSKKDHFAGSTYIYLYTAQSLQGWANPKPASMYSTHTNIYVHVSQGSNVVPLRAVYVCMYICMYIHIRRYETSNMYVRRLCLYYLKETPLLQAFSSITF